MEFRLLSYLDLSKDALYQVLRLRQQVFIDEQQSIYEDIDNLDSVSRHLLATDGSTLAGYIRLRLIEAGRVAKVERVVVAPSHRGIKLGHQLMDAVMDTIARTETVKTARLSAQLEVVPFYQKWGFEPCGEAYDDGGILHRDMACSTLSQNSSR